MSDINEGFAGFLVHDVQVSGAIIHCRIGGAGPPLLLLHGCPETHVMWHKVTQALSEHFTVVAADLRGYGNSSKPKGSENHANYSFRAMSLDQVELMAHFGYRRFAAVGHDRGARVLHRMALDHATTLSRIGILDILPTAVLYGLADREFATAYWEWFFFTQSGDFPETLLAADPAAFLLHEIGDLVRSNVISSDAFAEYLRALSEKGAMHGMCEDYRAGASIDLEHDAVDSGRKIEAPVLLLWGQHNPIWRRFDMLSVWRQHARQVSGAALSSGHYLAEEVPEELLRHLLPFLAAGEP